MKSKLILPLTFVFSVALTASGAGSGPGNGGDGYLDDNGKIQLLDFALGGLTGSESPYFNPHVRVDAAFQGRVDSTLPAIDPPVRVLIAKKLSEVAQVSPVTSEMFLMGMKMYSWKILDQDPREIYDEELIYDIPGDRLVQVAVRRSRMVSISRKWWLELEDSHKAGLVFHEVAYAFVNPTHWGRNRYRQTSVRAQEIVVYLFSSELSAKGLEGLQAVLGSDMIALTPHAKPTVSAQDLVWNKSAIEKGSVWVADPSYPFVVYNHRIPGTNGLGVGAEGLCRMSHNAHSFDPGRVLSFANMVRVSFNEYLSPDGHRHSYLNFCALVKPESDF